MKWLNNENNKKNIAIYALAVGVCLIIFFGYRLLFVAEVSEYSKEFISGCIGAVITIFATAALLKSQAESEITKDQLSGIFREKLNIFSSFITFLNSIHTDGELSHEEMKSLVEWGCKLSLICRPEVVQKIYEYTFQVVAFGETDYSCLTKKQKEQWKKWMLITYPQMEKDFADDEICQVCYASLPKIITYLRSDISNKKMSDFDQDLDMEETLENLLGLHSADEIVINDDGTYIITSVFEAEKKPRRSRGAVKKEL